MKKKFACVGDVLVGKKVTRFMCTMQTKDYFKDPFKDEDLITPNDIKTIHLKDEIN